MPPPPACPSPASRLARRSPSCALRLPWPLCRSAAGPWTGRPGCPADCCRAVRLPAVPALPAARSRRPAGLPASPACRLPGCPARAIFSSCAAGLVQLVAQLLRARALVGQLLRFAVARAGGRRQLVGRPCRARARAPAAGAACARGSSLDRGAVLPRPASRLLGRRRASRRPSAACARRAAARSSSFARIAGRRLRAGSLPLAPLRAARPAPFAARLLLQRLLQLSRALGEPLLFAGEPAHGVLARPRPAPSCRAPAAICRCASASCRASSCISPSARRRSSGRADSQLLLRARAASRARGCRARSPARDPAGAARSRRCASPRTRRASACCSRSAGWRLTTAGRSARTGPPALLPGLALLPCCPADPSRPACPSAADCSSLLARHCCAICRASSSACCRSSDCSRVSFSSSRFSSSARHLRALARELLLLLQQLVLAARQILDLVERALIRRRPSARRSTPCVS